MSPKTAPGWCARRVPPAAAFTVGYSLAFSIHESASDILSSPRDILISLLFCVTSLSPSGSVNTSADAVAHENSMPAMINKRRTGIITPPAPLFAKEENGAGGVIIDSLFIPQRIDRIQKRGLVGRIEAEEYPDEARKNRRPAGWKRRDDRGPARDDRKDHRTSIPRR